MIKEKTKQFYTLKNDIIFKNVFDTEERLKRLLEETLRLNINKVIKSNVELSVENIKERRKYLDLILETDKGIINVELNYGYKDELPYRNLLYFCKLISSNVKKTKSYARIDKHIQLNINWNLNKYLNFDITNKKIIKFHISNDETYEKLHEDIFEIVYINMDYFERVWYDGNIKEENPFLMLLAAPTKEKMDTICKGDNLMEKLNNKVKNLNDDSEIIDVIIENEDEIIMNSMYDRGFEKGINQGVSQGIQQGITERNVEIARKMLGEKIDISMISKVTGLSEKEIEDLR